MTKEERQVRTNQLIQLQALPLDIKILKTKRRPLSQPLSFWTEQDILNYIKSNNLKVASVYGNLIEDEKGKLSFDGCQRTGCMFCALGVHLEKGKNRFEKMKETHPKIYDYCINKLGLKEVLDFIGVKY